MNTAVISPQLFASDLSTALSGLNATLSGADFEQQLNKLADVSRNYIQQIEAVRQNALRTQAGEACEPIACARADPRFRSAVWQEKPYFDLLKQAYLIGSSFLQELVGTAAVDDKTRRRLQYFARQYTDAISPTNFFATNPEAVQLAIDTKGDSVVAGLKNLLDDIARGQISTQDNAAFEVGRNVATTPGAVVFENELIQLIQYAPMTETVDERPILIVPPCINKFYILDLQAENSFVRYAVSEGHQVFIISWRSATQGTGHLTWEDYLKTGIMDAIEVVREITQSAQVHALGFCVGGTLLSCATAVLRGRGEEPLATLTLITVLLDFAETGDIGLLVDEPLVALHEAMIGRGGVLHGKELASIFSSLRANDLVWPYVVQNYLKGKLPPALDLLFWNADSINLPGPMFCWYLRNAYLENRIRVSGGTHQCGVAVDLLAIDMPVYLLATREDHIVPWASAYATTHLVGGDVRFVLAASGHVAGVINPASRNKRSYWADGEQGIGPQTWLDTAQEVPGSWWVDWSRWLKQQGSQSVPAPVSLGSNRFPPIEPAPGRYAKAGATQDRSLI